MTPTTLVTSNPIHPAPIEDVWSVVSAVVWVALIVAAIVVANGLLNRWSRRLAAKKIA